MYQRGCFRALAGDLTAVLFASDLNAMLLVGDFHEFVNSSNIENCIPVNVCGKTCGKLMNLWKNLWKLWKNLWKLWKTTRNYLNFNIFPRLRHV
jgi:hypothetical protein